MTEGQKEVSIFLKTQNLELYKNKRQKILNCNVFNLFEKKEKKKKIHTTAHITQFLINDILKN